MIAALVLAASLTGFFNPLTYSQETANWALQAVAQDLGNLAAALMLLASLYFLKKRSIRAFPIWLGTLLYIFYAYLIFAFFVHFNFLFLVYVAILGLTFYATVGGLLEQDLQTAGKTMAIKRIKPSAILLILIGLLFILLWLSEIIPALLSGTAPQSLAAARIWVNPIHVIDLAFLLPGMIMAGKLLMRKQALGYLFAPALLAFSVLMGSSIVANAAMEMSTGNRNTMVPFVLVGTIVISSLAVLVFHLRQIK